MRKIIFLGLMLFVLASFCHALNVNDSARDFALPDTSGKKVSLDSLTAKGNVVVLAFFNAACEPCKKEMPQLHNIYYKYEGRAVKVRYINVGDSPTVINKYKYKHTVKIPILSDESGMLSGNYGVVTLPSIVIISKNKVVKKIIKGYSPNLEQKLSTIINRLLKEEKLDVRDRQITFFYGNSANGYLESCDCPSNPFGGLVRMSYLMDKLEFKNTIRLYNGDFFKPRGDELINTYCMKTIHAMKFDAICPGDQELSTGNDFFRSLLKKYPLPLVAADFSICDDKQCYNIAKKYIIKNVNGYKVAIIGVISPRTFLFFPKEQKKYIKVEKNPEDILKELVPRLRDKVDLVCVLSHSGEDQDMKIANAVQGIDIIFGGHSQSKTEQKIGNTLLLQAGANGSYLGQCIVTLDVNKKIEAYDNKFIPLTKNIPDDQNIRVMINELKLKQKKKAKKVKQ